MQKLIAIDDDMLSAAESLAARRRMSVDEIVTSILRSYFGPGEGPMRNRAGVLTIPRQPGARLVTSEHVNELRDDPL